MGAGPGLSLPLGFTVASLPLGRCAGVTPSPLARSSVHVQEKSSLLGTRHSVCTAVSCSMLAGRFSSASGGKHPTRGSARFFTAQQTRCLTPLFQLSRGPGISPQVAVLRVRLRSVGPVVPCPDHNTRSATSGIITFWASCRVRCPRPG